MKSSESIETVCCPVCARDVPLHVINFHLDNICDGSSETSVESTRKRYKEDNFKDKRDTLKKLKTNFISHKKTKKITSMKNTGKSSVGASSTTKPVHSGLPKPFPVTGNSDQEKELGNAKTNCSNIIRSTMKESVRSESATSSILNNKISNSESFSNLKSFDEEAKDRMIENSRLIFLSPDKRNNSNTSTSKTKTEAMSDSKLNIIMSPKIKYNPKRYYGAEYFNNDGEHPVLLSQSKSEPSRSPSSRYSPNIGRIRRSLSHQFGSVATDNIVGVKRFSNDGSQPFHPNTPYYLRNFEFIINFVTRDQHYDHLFNKEDKAFLENFRKASISSRKLYVRLFQRKRSWKRVEDFERYKEKDNIDPITAIEELVRIGLAVDGTHLEKLSEALPLLTATELKLLCKKQKLPQTTKSEMIESLVAFPKKHASPFQSAKQLTAHLLKNCKTWAGKCYRLLDLGCRVFLRVLLLFSLPQFADDEDAGRFSQLQELLLVQMGKLEYPDVKINRATPLFITRDDLIRFEEVSTLHNEMLEVIDMKEWVRAEEIYREARCRIEKIPSDIKQREINMPSFLRKLTSGSLLYRIVSLSVDVFEKQKKYDVSVDLLRELLDQRVYHSDYRGRWYDRLALDLHAHLKKPLDALSEIRKALWDPDVRVGHRLALSQRASKILKKGNFEEKDGIEEVKFTEAPEVVVYGRRLRTSSQDNPRIRLSFLRSNDVGDQMVCAVEEFVIGHYKEQGYYEGIHGEGITWNSLWALLFWDIIYELDVPDVFRSCFQGFPLDIDSDHFYASRKAQIDQRVKDIKNSSHEVINKRIADVWKAHNSQASKVNWEMFRNVEHLQSLVVCLPPSLIAGICDRFCKDHRFTRSGLPDLVVWNPVKKIYKIVEVKGPGDHLSTKQILWLDYLLSLGGNAEVCYVKALGAKDLSV